MALILDGTDGITSSGGTNVLQDDAVITANIADGAVVAAKIADGAVSDAKIAAMAATKLTGDVAAARITTALNAPGSAPIFAARAWVNFDGTGTVAIRASGNVSSITDNGTGDYTVNFTTAMPDANYSWQINTGTQGATFGGPRASFNNTTPPSTNSLRVNIKITTNADNSDMAAVTVAIFR